jgi:hypothetical protein
MIRIGGEMRSEEVQDTHGEGKEFRDEEKNAAVQWL